MTSKLQRKQYSLKRLHGRDFTVFVNEKDGGGLKDSLSNI